MRDTGSSRRGPLAHAFVLFLFLSAHVRTATTTTPLPRVPFDLSNPEEFNRAMELRVSLQKRLILFVFNERSGGDHTNHLGQMWWLMLFQLIMQLENRAMNHYIALADSPELCEHLHQRWPLPEDSGIVPSCAYSSEPYKSHNTSYHQGNIADLWATRYYIMAKFAERGVDTLLIDTDYEINSDVWEVLDSPLLLPYHIIGLGEGPLNGGTMFVRGTEAHPKGAALWIIREVERQTSLLRDAEYADPAHPSDPGRRDDQVLLGEALRIASNAPKATQWDFRDLYRQTDHKDHPFWKEHPQDEKILGPPLDLNIKMTDPVPWPNTTCPVHNNEAACERFRNYLAEATRDVPGIRYADICVPHDSPSYDASVPCEKLGFGPNWLWVHGYFGRYGWRSHAVHHVLHIDKYYSKGRAGSHAGRMAWLLARGVVDPRVLVLPPREDLLVQKPDDEWEKSFLYNSSAHTKFIIKEFVKQAVAEKKIPVFAAIDCQAKWLDDSDKTESGKLDVRVVETPDGKCYPSPGGYDDCMPNVHFMYDFQLAYYDLGIKFKDGVESMWEKAGEGDQFMEECEDFTKILDADPER